AFNHLAVFKLQAHPQAFGAGTGGEGLAEHQVGVGKLADKINGFDVAQVDGDHVAGSVEQFELSIHHKVGGSYETADRVAVVFPHDHLFVGRGHGSWDTAKVRTDRAVRGGNGSSRWDSRTFLMNSPSLCLRSSQTVNVVLFSLVY